MKKMLAQFMPMSSFKKHMMEIKYTSERDSYIYSSFLPSYRNYFHLFWGMLKYQLSQGLLSLKKEESLFNYLFN